MAEPSPLIEISGPPRERGLQYGRAAASRIRRGIAHYVAQIRGLAADDRAVPDLLGALVPAIERFDPDLVPEMRSIAAGAGVSFEEDPAFERAHRGAEARLPAASPRRRSRTAAPAWWRCPRRRATAGCSTPRTGTGSSSARRPRSFCMSAARTGRISSPSPRRARSPAPGSTPPASRSPRTSWERSRGPRDLGVPLALIRRAALPRSISRSPCAASIARRRPLQQHDPEPRRRHRDRFRMRAGRGLHAAAERGLIVHANHWQSPVALGRLRERAIAVVPDSLYRDLRVGPPERISAPSPSIT